MSSFDLDADEQRVLGTLIEKQLATPQYYPLTLSALVQGCNQSTSRDPITHYSEGEVRDILGRLKDKQLLRTILPSHGRSVDRYGHRLDEQMPLIKEELALARRADAARPADREPSCRTRTERLADWEAPDTAASILDRLANKPEPLAQNIGRGPGQSQDRWIHLLGPVDTTPVRGLLVQIRRSRAAIDQRVGGTRGAGRKTRSGNGGIAPATRRVGWGP